MKKKMNLDWWAVTGVLEMLIGVVSALAKVNTDVMAQGIVLGAVQVIFGVALLQKSKIVFWLGLVMAAVNLLSVLNGIAKGMIDMSSVSYLVAVAFVGVRFAAYVMLYQQIRSIQGKKTSVK